MRLGKIYRYPVKGFTPQQLEHGQLTAGAGLAYDRYCGFSSGNLPDQPAPGTWVPARTFLQLTVYPELASFKADFDESGPSITVTAPDGQTAHANLDTTHNFADVNKL
ncbi:MAG: hypothetical protein HKN11_13415, partial [Rhizobiales bacterium]|nr:hypothetical protein [Hyphomicrobiales bacterium]